MPPGELASLAWRLHLFVLERFRALRVQRQNTHGVVRQSRSSKMKIRAGVFARAVHQFCRCNPYPEHQDDAAGWIQGWWREYDLGASA